ncbi:MAG: hypothetical protein JSS30_00560 [Verrucomicrobia bacterium]|nr:hypothetical protein [Verrucomicrobiota bacterium]
MSRFCVATKPAPLLNTPDFQKVFGSQTLPVDEKGLLRCLETIALPGTKFEILREVAPFALEVTTADYPGKVFVDSRFVTPVSAHAPERPKILPDTNTIIARLQSALGLPYVWGGNCRTGIPEILSLYNPPIPENLHSTWTLCGLDCSGLLYEATDGYTPRNTSELIHFGQEVSSPKPLDIIVYPGHVIIVFDPQTTIESRYGKGVVLTSLTDRLAELARTKFYIRRFL